MLKKFPRNVHLALAPAAMLLIPPGGTPSPILDVLSDVTADPIYNSGYLEDRGCHFDQINEKNWVESALVVTVPLQIKNEKNQARTIPTSTVLFFGKHDWLIEVSPQNVASLFYNKEKVAPEDIKPERVWGGTQRLRNECTLLWATSMNIK